jgi:hypothetical protein
LNFFQEKSTLSVRPSDGAVGCRGGWGREPMVFEGDLRRYRNLLYFVILHFYSLDSGILIQ